MLDGPRPAPGPKTACRPTNVTLTATVQVLGLLDSKEPLLIVVLLVSNDRESERFNVDETTVHWKILGLFFPVPPISQTGLVHNVQLPQEAGGTISP